MLNILCSGFYLDSERDKEYHVEDGQDHPHSYHIVEVHLLGLVHVSVRGGHVQGNDSILYGL